MTPSFPLFLSCVEPSGDLIGAEVLQTLWTQLNQKNKASSLPPSSLSIEGVGGERCQAQGLKSLFPLEDLTVYGLTEVIPKIPLIRRRLHQMKERILQIQPAVVLTIDGFSFHYRLAKALRRCGYKGRLIHLVAPAVWAWGGGRAQKLMDVYDNLLCILPFEPPYFHRDSFRVSYVGHPVLTRFTSASPSPHLPEAFRKTYGLQEGAFVLTLLPGSRAQEVNGLLDDFLRAAQRLHQHFPALHVLIPTFPQFHATIAEKSKGLPFPVSMVDQKDKEMCFHHTDFAIAASGTVTLELACFSFPFLVAYRVSFWTAFLAKKMAKVSHISLVNLLLKEAIVPELIQSHCTPARLAEEALRLLQDANKKEHFLQKTKEALRVLSFEEDKLGLSLKEFKGSMTKSMGERVAETLWPLLRSPFGQYDTLASRHGEDR